MKLFLSIAGLAAILFTITAVFGAPHYPRYTLPAHEASVVLLKTKEHRCTGFMLLPNTIATARHCVLRGTTLATDIIAVYNTGRVIPATVIFTGTNDTTDDFAILKVAAPAPPPYAIAVTPIAMDQLLQVIGYGGDNENQKAIPIIFKYFDVEGYYQLAGNIVAGDSGAPLFNMQGEVVGLVVRTGYPIPNSAAIPITRVLQGFYNRGAK